MRIAAPMGIVALALVAAPAWAQDSDADGVYDGADLFPCDGTVAGELYAPGAGVHGQLLFEDQWPQAGDTDFNDAVIGYHYTFRTDAQGAVKEIIATYNVLAVGGDYRNGLGVHLPVAATNVGSVTRRIGAGPLTDLVPSATDSELTVRVLDDLRVVVQDQQGPVNSQPGLPAVSPQVVRVRVVLAAAVSIATGNAPFDVFIFRTNTPSHEIHRPEYAGTASMNQTLFGSSDDASTPGRSFVEVSGVPFALVVPEDTEYPAEATPIASLFPRILTFGSSGGAQDKDFYATPTATHAYRPSTGLRPRAGFLAGLAVDRACLPAQRGSCAQILAAGESTGDGTYRIDLDGAGPGAAQDVYCDMTNGGWTRLVDYNASRDGNAWSTHAANWTSIDAAMQNESSMCCGRYGCNSSSIVYAGMNYGNGLDYDTQFYRLDLSNIGPTQIRFDHYDQVHSWDGALYIQAGLNTGNSTNRVIYDNHSCSLDRGACPGSEVNRTYNTTHYINASAPITEFRWGVKHYQGSCGDAHRIYRYAIWFKEPVAPPATADRTCRDLLARNSSAATGWHWIDLDGAGGAAPQLLWCDMTTDGGGWTRLVDYDAARDGNGWSTHAANWTSVDARMNDESGQCCSRFGCNSSSVLYAGNNDTNGDQYVTQFYHLDLTGQGATEVRFVHNDRVESWDGGLYVQGDLQGGGSTARVIYRNHGCSFDQGPCNGNETSGTSVAGTHFVDGAGQVLDTFRWGVKHYQGSCGDAHRIYSYSVWSR